ncbi:hypothetical protein EG68_04244 [Paragonimus skrjabini miyazakii]|uniref:Uncharacterized protein n=1 Tax=Paragonimus skrjabini miyazakii TaxID=59628 RepID=A0A8S9YWW0_9TREM|nr:hypothetical protein EG68_04244 [Paragonimus skrjabini miyazakii]
MEEQLQALEMEKSDLLLELQRSKEKHEKQQEFYLSRLLNADFLLAQLGSILPVKRPPSRSTSASQSGFHLSSPVLCAHLLEPASNVVYSKMQGTLRDAVSRAQQSNDDCVAWKFDPESANGKRLMSRMRDLLSENETLGRVNQADCVRLLEAEMDAQTTCLKEFSTTHEGIDGVLEEAFTDLKGLQNNVLMLHQQIKELESIVGVLQSELEAHRSESQSP